MRIKGGNQTVLERFFAGFEPGSASLAIKEAVMEEVADVRAIFYSSRNGLLEEVYEDEVEGGIRALERSGDMHSQMLHVFTK